MCPMSRLKARPTMRQPFRFRPRLIRNLPLSAVLLRPRMRHNRAVLPMGSLYRRRGHSDVARADIALGATTAHLSAYPIPTQHRRRTNRPARSCFCQAKQNDDDAAGGDRHHDQPVREAVCGRWASVCGRWAAAPCRPRAVHTLGRRPTVHGLSTGKPRPVVGVRRP